MVYAKRRRTGFRSVRGRYRYRPTSYRTKKVSWWRRRRTRYAYKKSRNLLQRNYQYVKLTQSSQNDYDVSATPGYNNLSVQLNNINSSGVGGTPTGHSLMSTMFGRYKVCAAKVIVRAWNTGTAPILIGLQTHDSSKTLPSTAKTVQQALLEQSLPHCTLLPQGYSSANAFTLRKFYRMKDIVGLNAYKDADFTALCSGGPTNIAYLKVWHVSDEGQTIPGATHSVRYLLTVKFYVKYFDNVVAAVD